jgi:hypothetical protein
MAYWSCVQLEPNRERLTLHCLSAVNGFEIYSPRILIKAPRSRRDDVTSRNWGSVPQGIFASRFHKGARFP